MPLLITPELHARLRYLLLQTRNAGDPMAAQEVRCFARMLDCEVSAIEVFDLLSRAPPTAKLDSGRHAAAGRQRTLFGGRRRARGLERALDCDARDSSPGASRRLHPAGAFKRWRGRWAASASTICRMRKLGTIELQLTDAGRDDPLFGQLPPTFRGTGRA